MNLVIFYHLYIGFLCGVTLSLNSFIFTCMIVDKGFSIIYLGYSYLSLLPYSFVFLWSYVFDFYLIRIWSLDAIKSWFLCSVIGMAISMLYLGCYLHSLNFMSLILCNFFICFFSVSKDVLLGYWRISIDDQIIDKSRYYVIGYRLGMFIIIFFALRLISYGFSWNSVYLIIACIILICMLFFLYLTLNIELKQNAKRYNILYEIYNYRYILLALFLYNMSDRLIMSVLKKFLIDYGFSIAEIGVFKIYAIIGLLFGGWSVGYIGFSINNFFYIGLIHVCIHLLFYLHAIFGKSYFLHIITIALESITGGMCMSLYMSYISSVTNSIYVYSMLSAIMGLSNVLLPIFAGYLVYYLDWQHFFLFIFLLGGISVYLSYYLLLYYIDK